MKQIEVLETLESAASEQWGIITTSQAQREGITRLQLGRLADKGVLTRVRRGMYLLPSSQFGPLTDIRVAWVSLDVGQFPDERWEEEDKIVVSHESAALIHQLGDLIPKKLTFSSTSRKQTSQDDIHIYNNRDISSQDVSNVGGLPVTSVILTVTDLAKKKIEFSYLASIVVDALRKENVRLKDIAERLNEVSLSYGCSSGLQLVQACQEEAEADEDREEKAERYLSTWGAPSLQHFVRLGLADHSFLTNPLGRYVDTAALSELAKYAGTTGVSELAKYAGTTELSGATALSELAKFASAAGNLSLNESNSKPKQSDKAPSGESLLSSPDPVQEQPEVNEGGNNKKEHRE